MNLSTLLKGKRKAIERSINLCSNLFEESRAQEKLSLQKSSSNFDEQRKNDLEWIDFGDNLSSTSSIDTLLAILEGRMFDETR